MSRTALNVLALALVSSVLVITGCNQDSEEPAEAAATDAQVALPVEEAAPAAPAAPAPQAVPEVLVFGSTAESRAWLESQNWWGTDWSAGNLEVPQVLVTGITERWRTESQNMPVADKKEAFFRFMLPLVMHANAMVMDRRQKLEAIQQTLAAGTPPDAEQFQLLRQGAIMLRVATEDEIATLTPDSPAWKNLTDTMLYRLDMVPPGLALGQAAYESGWGTSRFAQEGNALFGQWTYGGEGIAPEHQRKELGDHRIAAFDWPFDSVRGYFMNLMSHPAYEDFRRLRAELRASGQPMDSLHLADGLLRYSERGQEYVDSLKSMIRVNHFDAADTAVFRDEPLRFYVGAESPEDAEKLRQEIAHLRETGELAKIYERMKLD